MIRIKTRVGLRFIYTMDDGMCWDDEKKKIE